jgi:hypothetical protein
MLWYSRGCFFLCIEILCIVSRLFRRCLELMLVMNLFQLFLDLQENTREIHHSPLLRRLSSANTEELMKLLCDTVGYFLGLFLTATNRN